MYQSRLISVIGKSIKCKYKFMTEIRVLIPFLLIPLPWYPSLVKVGVTRIFLYTSAVVVVCRSDFVCWVKTTDCKETRHVCIADSRATFHCCQWDTSWRKRRWCGARLPGTALESGRECGPWWLRGTAGRWRWWRFGGVGWPDCLQGWKPLSPSWRLTATDLTPLSHSALQWTGSWITYPT